MPCITLQTDLTKGLTLPCRVHSFTGIGMRMHVTISTGFSDSMISPAAAERLALVPIGETELHMPYATIRHAPFYLVTIDVLFGLLGLPQKIHRLQRVTLVESELARGRGVVLGCDLITRGHLTMNASTVTICI